VPRPKIDWWTPVMGRREKELICQVIDQGFPNDGEYTTTFEKQIAEISGVPYAVAVTSGTAAIFLGLVACGIGPGDEVLVPDITFIATAHAVKLAGATPVFVDVDKTTYCMDANSAERCVTKRTKAIIPVHVSGRGADMVRILSVAQNHGLHVVEDAADALGSKVSGVSLGSFGDVGCFSFTATKIVTTGQGGVIVTKNPILHGRLRELKDQGRPVRGTGGNDAHPSLGFNFKMTNLQAAMGLAQLESFEERRKHQCEMYRVYCQGLAANSAVQLAQFRLESGEYPLWVDALVEGRDSLHDYLLAHNVQTRKYWLPVHTQPVFRTSDTGFENSLHVGRHGLWLPSALKLTMDEIREVCALINAWAAGA
jgi:perosamine synthetase